MKREALKHPKMMDLAWRLQVSRAHAVGILTLLLDWCADVTPQGNIGRWSNGTIAHACDAPIDADAFVDALVGSGWVDRCDDHRLVIHDLEHHSERWWKLKIEKLGLTFLRAKRTTAPAIGGSVEASIEGRVSRDRTKPNQTKPNPVSSGAGLLQVGVEDLTDTGELIRRLELEQGRTKPLLGNSERDQLRILGAAERALEVGDKPVRLFVSLVRDCSWSLISNEQENRAVVRLRDFRKSKPVSEFGVTVGKIFTANGDANGQENKE